VENNDTELKVIYFLSEFSGFQVNQINLKTELNKDLGIDGDDAIELINLFSKNFNVKIDSFDFKKRFNPEYPLYFKIFVRREFELLSITVNDLIQSVYKGFLK
jgi:acyl carrier protein